MPRVLDPRYAVLGIIDGIIIALGLGAKIIFASRVPANIGNIVLDAGVFAAITNLTTSFFTEMHQARTELLEVERKMLIPERGRLFRTALYQSGRLKALLRAFSFSVTAFAGASIPLLPVLFVRHQPLVGLLMPLAALFGLGFYLGRKGAGNALLWAFGMVAAGMLVTLVGRFFPA
jgi:predicted membrane protein (TIGR00267 family)